MQSKRFKLAFLFFTFYFYLLPSPLRGSTGCSYPASLDTWADKAAGDNLTQGDLNARTCAIEKLESGPIRPNKGSASVPAYSFQADTDTGVDSLAADTVSLIAGGAEIVRATTTQLAPASGKHIVASKNNCAALGQFVQSDGTCASPVGLSGSLAQNSKNNATTPNSQFDLAAAAVILRDTNNVTVVRYNPAPVTVDVDLAGPAANGRDQAGAFSASSWIHFYWIWNGTTLAGLASLTDAALPSGSLALPTGYTHWSYAGAVRYDATPNLVKTRIKRGWAFYEKSVQVLSAGAATAETTVSTSAAAPPNAIQYSLYGTAQQGGATQDLKIRIVTGADFILFDFLAGAGQTMIYAFAIPNVGQQFFYLWGAAPSTGVTLSTTGYELPNGGV